MLFVMMFKKFLVITVFFLTCLSSFSQNVKFIQATDVHMTKDNFKFLEQFIDEDINKKHSDIDFLVFSGDNINRPNEKDLDLFLGIIKKAKPPVYVIPGNHDLYKQNDMDNVVYMKKVKKELGHYHSSKPNYIFEKKGIVFITMNGVKEVIPGPNGYYRESELKWLDKNLTKYKNKKVVIIQHFPLVDTSTKGHSLYKKDAYLEVLKKHSNVIAVLSGHYHYNYEGMQDGVYNIVTSKFGNNNNYKIIEIDSKTGFIFTSLISK